MHSLMHIINTFQELVQNLRLGTLLSSPMPLSGGALHKMWAFTTDQGDYVAKQINQYITTKPNFLKAYQCSEEIARTFSQKGIPAVSAIDIDNRFVHPIHDHWFIIYSKVAGKTININDLKKEHAVQIGKIFSSMHKLNIVIKSVDKPHYDQFSNEYWENLIFKTKYEVLKQIIPTIQKWNTAYKNAIPVLNENLVITHRDLHHTNVLWQENKPWIIDWESAVT